MIFLFFLRNTSANNLHYNWKFGSCSKRKRRAGLRQKTAHSHDQTSSAAKLVQKILQQSILGSYHRRLRYWTSKRTRQSPQPCCLIPTLSDIARFSVRLFRQAVLPVLQQMIKWKQKVTAPKGHELSIEVKGARTLTGVQIPCQGQ